MVKIREAIVVEGRYDQNTLSQIVDAPIFQTNGFGIMKDRAQLDLLRLVAKNRKLIVFTDSDGAGFVIRNFLKSSIEPQYLLHAYIPDVSGKEKRKRTPGKEGKLGVEGMTPQVILDCLYRAGATIEGETITRTAAITKQDMMELGLSGAQDSAQKRKILMKHLGFPEHMSSNALVQALSLLYTKEELSHMVLRLFGEGK
jgi:ribonuclease M5